MIYVQRLIFCFFAVLLFCTATMVFAQQQSPFQRLPMDSLDSISPAVRVVGEPGQMSVQQRACRDFPQDQIRRRIVNIAIQEWAYFGFNVFDQTQPELPRLENELINASFTNTHNPYSSLSVEEMSRIANSIGGYWSATFDANWILSRQNEMWQSLGMSARWRDAWSAAFISWVMCEGGVSDTDQFERAIGHHTYIDQAILARESVDTQALYQAFNPGERSITPGDLLCRGSRPRYQNIDERRRQLGVGARTHCDMVVKVDEPNQQIMAIGGNVKETVGMKVFSAASTENKLFHPTMVGRRAIFAHLKMKSNAIEVDALDHSPTMKALACVETAPLFDDNIAVIIESNC